jgi:hypothetical protein
VDTKPNNKVFLCVLPAPGYEKIKKIFEGYLPLEKKIEIQSKMPDREEVKFHHIEMIVN